jgi:VanZ family protein
MTGAGLRTAIGWIPAGLWTGALYLLLTMPLTVQPSPLAWPLRIPHIDKAVHFVLFAVLAWLIFSPLRRIKPDIARPAAWFAFGLAALYGAWLEYVQTTLPFRHGDLTDAIANGCGATTVLLATYGTTWRNRLRIRPRRGWTA